MGFNSAFKGLNFACNNQPTHFNECIHSAATCFGPNLDHRQAIIIRETEYIQKLTIIKREIKFMFLYFLPKSMLVSLCIQFSMSWKTLLRLLANSIHTHTHSPYFTLVPNQLVSCSCMCMRILYI